MFGTRSTRAATASHSRLVRRRLVVATLPLALAVTALTAASAPNVATAAAARPSRATARPAGTQTGPNVALAGLGGRRHTITLITGDQVTLTPLGGATNGAYSVTIQRAPRADGFSPTIQVSGSHTAAGADETYALPDDAAALVQAGRLDQGLFNIRYLATHEDNGKLPVVVQYAKPLHHDALTSRTSRLLGSALSRTLGSDTALVSVDLRHATAFWAALVGPHRPNAEPTNLGHGIARVWLAGHKPSADGGVHQRPDQTDVGTYELTVDITFNDPRIQTSIPNTALLGGFGRIFGGPDGRSYKLDMFNGWACVPNTDCGTLRTTYRLPAGTYMIYLEPQLRESSWHVNPYFVNPQFTVVSDTKIAFTTADLQRVTVDCGNVPPIDSMGIGRAAGFHGRQQS